MGVSRSCLLLLRAAQVIIETSLVETYSLGWNPTGPELAIPGRRLAGGLGALLLHFTYLPQIAFLTFGLHVTVSKAMYSAMGSLTIMRETKRKEIISYLFD